MSYVLGLPFPASSKISTLFYILVGSQIDVYMHLGVFPQSPCPQVLGKAALLFSHVS